MDKYSTTGKIRQIGIIFSIGLLLSFQQSVERPEKQSLKHALHPNSIKSVKIVSGTDTVSVQQLDIFLSEICASKNIGRLKFPCTFKILITRKFRDDESILTNGKIFEYDGYCYSATSDIITRYLAN